MQVEADAEVLRLRAELRDLVALSAIPVAWVGMAPSAVAAGLADTLAGLLKLDFAFVRLCDPGGDGAVEATRGSAWPSFPEWLEGRLDDATPFRDKEVVPVVGDDAVQRRGLAVPVGVNGEGGVVAATSGLAGFPTPTDQLLLSLAANHAAAVFHSARLIDERKRAEAELRGIRDALEVSVAERTAELQVANDELSALRHVATLVAEGIEPQDLFALVAEEVGRLLGLDASAVVRFDEDDRAIILVGASTSIASVVPVGTRWDVDDSLAAAEVYRTGRSARDDARDWSPNRPAVPVVGDLGVVSTVASPIIVEGRRWGAMTVSSMVETLPRDLEERLEKFTELVATAIANAESREALGRLADEQATLRRMATLVAQGVPPGKIFSAVSEEVGRLFGADAAVLRYEPDGPAVVFVGVGKSLEGRLPVGTRWELDDSMASAEVYRTGRSARVDAIDWSSRSGPVAEAGKRLGVVSTVAGPIVVVGRLWGAVSVSSSDVRLPVGVEERLERFTDLVGTAIANAESRSELAGSRRRIVAASDEARRRFERDLHDGTQQRLVSLALAVRAAEANISPDRADLRAELSDIAIELADAVEQLQEISRGIHPPILSEGGLAPALRTLARRSPIPVELDVTMTARLPEPIEVAAYYVASEAFANAAKHAQASLIEVSLATRDGCLLLTLRDDGVGGADYARGSGLVGLTDRVEALGGSMLVQSRPLDGTLITAKLPLQLEEGSDMSARGFPA
jgi:signal transduction histidine kinase